MANTIVTSNVPVQVNGAANVKQHSLTFDGSGAETVRAAATGKTNAIIGIQALDDTAGSYVISDGTTTITHVVPANHNVDRRLGAPIFICAEGAALTVNGPAGNILLFTQQINSTNGESFRVNE